MSASIAPIITIDGPSGVGKGTISQMLTKHYNWNYLDSGALYRITAYAISSLNIDLLTISKQEVLVQESNIAQLALSLNIVFTSDGEVLLDNNNITAFIRTEICGNKASIIAVLPKVRSALLQKQKDFHMKPGLIADGRDMGTVVFPDAELKIYLTASAQERGNRRFKQLQESHENAIVAGSTESTSLLGKPLVLKQIIEDVKQRDERDMNRKISPLKPAEDAHIIDTSDMSINDVFSQIKILFKNL